MAAARQCDICGEAYPMYNSKKRDPDNTNGIMFINIDEDGTYWKNDKIDLCPGCMESIRAHIDILRQRGGVR